MLWFSTDTVVNDAELASDAIAQEFLNKAWLVITAFAPASNPVSERVSEQAAEISARLRTYMPSPRTTSSGGSGSRYLRLTRRRRSYHIRNADRAGDYPGALGSIVLNDAGDMAEAT